MTLQLNPSSPSYVQSGANTTSADQLVAIDQAFENLMGVSYDFKNSNAIDRWIYGFLQVSVHGDIKSLRGRLDILHSLHADNQHAILSSAYEISKKNGKTAICHLILDEISALNERSTGSKFDFTKETSPEILIRDIVTPRFEELRAVFMTSSIAWIASCTYAFFDPAFRSCRYLVGEGDSDGLATKMEGCVALTNKSAYLLYDYAPTLLLVAGGCIVGYGLYKITQFSIEAQRTFTQFTQRLTNNNEIEKAIHFCAKHVSIIPDTQIYQVGLKALRQGHVQLAIDATKMLSKRKTSEALYNQIAIQASAIRES